MSVEISVDTNEYDLMIGIIQSGTKDMMPFFTQQSALIIQDELEGAVPVKTGKLKRSIRSDIFGDSAKISTNSGYGLFVDLPTKPHIIKARNTPFLRIPLPSGEVIFRRQVFHTGTKGHFFRRKALNASSPRIKEMMQNKLRDVFA